MYNCKVIIFQKPFIHSMVVPTYPLLSNSSPMFRENVFTNPSSLQLLLCGRPGFWLQCIMQHLLVAFQKSFGILQEQRKNTSEGTAVVDTSYRRLTSLFWANKHQHMPLAEFFSQHTLCMEILFSVGGTDSPRLSCDLKHILSCLQGSG